MISALGNLLVSLGQVGGEGGGSETVTVFTPLHTDDLSRFRPFRMPLYVGDTSAVQIPVYDASNNPVDLTALGSLLLTIEDGQNSDVQVVENSSLDIDGSEDNLLVFSPSAATVSQPRSLKVSLRKAGADKRVVIAGILDVQYEPGP